MSCVYFTNKKSLCVHKSPTLNMCGQKGVMQIISVLKYNIQLSYGWLFIGSSWFRQRFGLERLIIHKGLCLPVLLNLTCLRYSVIYIDCLPLGSSNLLCLCSPIIIPSKLIKNEIHFNSEVYTPQMLHGFHILLRNASIKTTPERRPPENWRRKVTTDVVLFQNKDHICPQP